MKNPPNRYRVTEGKLASTPEDGNNGAFLIPHPRPKARGHCLLCVVSDGMGWEHVSVSHFNVRHGMMQLMPSWDDMCLIKNLFWMPGEAVMQLHPAQKDYVDNHPYCLHLWRPTEGEIPLPDPMMVGFVSKKPVLSE